MPTGCRANHTPRPGALGFGLSLLALATACRTSPHALAVDVGLYLAQVQEWAPMEGETNRTIERILGTQFVDEAEVRRQIGANRTAITAHLARIRSYGPRTTPVAQLHLRYVGGWERLLEGYGEIEEGFTSGDYSHVTRGRQAMLAWRDAIRRVAAELRTLADQAGIPARGGSGQAPEPLARGSAGAAGVRGGGPLSIASRCGGRETSGPCITSASNSAGCRSSSKPSTTASPATWPGSSRRAAGRAADRTSRSAYAGPRAGSRS